MSRNTEGNGKYGDATNVPKISTSHTPKEGTLAHAKAEFFKKEQKDREAIGKETIGSLKDQKATVFALNKSANIRFRQMIRGKLIAMDVVEPGDKVTLLGKYVVTQKDGVNHGLLKVELSDGREGYIAADQLKIDIKEEVKDNIPTAEWVDGKVGKWIKIDGIVLDVEGVRPGKIMKDKDTGKKFRVPKIPETEDKNPSKTTPKSAPDRISAPSTDVSEDVKDVLKNTEEAPSNPTTPPAPISSPDPTSTPETTTASSLEQSKTEVQNMLKKLGIEHESSKVSNLNGKVRYAREIAGKKISLVINPDNGDITALDTSDKGGDLLLQEDGQWVRSDEEIPVTLATIETALKNLQSSTPTTQPNSTDVSDDVMEALRSVEESEGSNNEATKPNIESRIGYTIEDGDTVDQLATRFFSSEEEMQRLNPGKDLNKLSAGDYIIVPFRGSSEK